eukprot:m51a1_g2358 hypothetical protein (498) ;mRNA; f:607484-609533
MSHHTSPALCDAASVRDSLSRFVPRLCNVCKKGGPLPSRRCSRCRCVWYCSREHQRLDWPRHRQVCTALFYALRTSSSGDPALPPASWPAVLARCQRSLGRSLTRPEQDLVALAPRCAMRGCGALLLAPWRCALFCARCEVAAFCSSEHAHAAAADHQCPQRSLLVACERSLAASGGQLAPCVPQTVRPVYRPMCSWAEYFEARGMQDALGRPEARAMATEQLSGPLTVVRALEALRGREWVRRVVLLEVHVASCDPPSDLLPLAKYEEISHLLPSLCRLIVRFVGPSVPVCALMTSSPPPRLSEGPCLVEEEWKCCEECERKGKRAAFSGHAAPYYEFLGPSQRDPDLLVAFNSTCRCDTAWMPTLESVARSRVACAFTTTSELSAMAENAMIWAAMSDIRHEGNKETEVFAPDRIVPGAHYIMRYLEALLLAQGLAFRLTDSIMPVDTFKLVTQDVFFHEWATDRSNWEERINVLSCLVPEDVVARVSVELIPPF